MIQWEEIPASSNEFFKDCPYFCSVDITRYEVCNETVKQEKKPKQNRGQVLLTVLNWTAKITCREKKVTKASKRVANLSPEFASYSGNENTKSPKVRDSQ